VLPVTLSANGYVDFLNRMNENLKSKEDIVSPMLMYKKLIVALFRIDGVITACFDSKAMN